MKGLKTTDPKKFFKNRIRDQNGNAGTKREYLCSIPNCPKGIQNKGLLERGNREISHLRKHLKSHASNGEMNLSESGRFSIAPLCDINDMVDSSTEVCLYMFLFNT